MKKNILLFVFLIASILAIGGCGNRNKTETELVGNTEIIKKEKENLSWLVGTWIGYDSYMNQDCAIVLKANEDGSFLKKGGGYDTVYILGCWYISDSGRLCVSSGERKVYFDIDREKKSLISNSGTVFTKK
ncbi:hypothetical protein [Bacteroides intestinalis]|uniref:hypothetical protein n=1 Tax=Bacteroides intestinalis TaxID=329854 RepID=UPI0018A0F691|nr:hypothetical protein [Bacteroides intestinalis]